MAGIGGSLASVVLPGSSLLAVLASSVSIEPKPMSERAFERSTGLLRFLAMFSHSPSHSTPTLTGLTKLSNMFILASRVYKSRSSMSFDVSLDTSSPMYIDADCS